MKPYEQMTPTELQQELARQQQLLTNYEELGQEQIDDEAYVARGNGFCDSKYSPEFIDSQIEKIQNNIRDIERLMGK